MTGIKKSTKKGKRDLYEEDAESLYLRARTWRDSGTAAGAPPDPEAVASGRAMGGKTAAGTGIPPMAGRGPEGHLAGKGRAAHHPGDLKTQELDELSKIVTLLDRLCSQGWDMRAAALEVMDRFMNSCGSG